MQSKSTSNSLIPCYLGYAYVSHERSSFTYATHQRSNRYELLPSRLCLNKELMPRLPTTYRVGSHGQSSLATISREGTIGKADGQTLESFYRAHYDPIYGYVFQSVKNHHDAEDVTATIFLKVVSGMDKTRGSTEVNIWLFQLTRTTIADYWRTRARASFSSHEALLDTGWEGPTEVPLASHDTAVDRVHLLLQALPPHYREVLLCRFLLTLSIRDTARHMGLTVANVKVMQFRALKRAAAIAPTVLG